MGCAISFSFGWHVHEKAILMVTIPLLVASARSTSSGLRSATAILSLVGTFSLLPLLPTRSKESLVKWVLFLLGHAWELWWLRDDKPGSRSSLVELLRLGPLPGVLLGLSIICVGVYSDLGGHQLVF